ncbi:MAG: helix-turn-helix transcriptional regulator [Actinomycetales bacterium]
MSRDRTERLLNLTIALLSTRRFLSREEIRRLVPGYPESDEAFERSFERDKDALRSMGVPVETGSNSAWFEDEVGYRIPRAAYELPELTLTAAEMSVLTLAAQAWSSAALGSAAAAALRKLKAASGESVGADADEDALTGLVPRVATAEPAFAALWQAVRDGRAVRFPYRRSGAADSEVREVEPWGLVSWHGHWYLVGHDRGRDEPRVFRLSRVTGPPSAIGARGQVQVPQGVDLTRLVHAANPSPSAADGAVTLRVRHHRGHLLRRRAVAAVPAAEAGWEDLTVPLTDLDDLAAEVASFAGDVVPVAPAALVAAVRRVLLAVAEVHQETA